MKKLLGLIVFVTSILNAQNSELDSLQKEDIPEKDQIKIELKMGVEDEDLQTFFDFENIAHFSFKITGPALKNKAFVIRIKEFKNGELIKTETLFDERGSDFFKTDSTSMSFKLLTRLDNKNLKTWIRGEKFGSKKSYFELEEKNKARYATKDFIGGKDYLVENIKKPFYLLAIMTPYITETGAGQYCQVAYSDIDPENFGKHFDIPHYFLIQMEFLE